MNQEILTYDWVKIMLREVYVRVYLISILAKKTYTKFHNYKYKVKKTLV